MSCIRIRYKTHMKRLSISANYMDIWNEHLLNWRIIFFLNKNNTKRGQHHHKRYRKLYKTAQVCLYVGLRPTRVESSPASGEEPQTLTYAWRLRPQQWGFFIVFYWALGKGTVNSKVWRGTRIEPGSVLICICVWIYVCTYVCRFVCMYVQYVCTYMIRCRLWFVKREMKVVNIAVKITFIFFLYFF